jgi:regulator of sigma E protease
VGSIPFIILAAIIVLGPLVVFHEFGHFIVAKLLGIRVDVFSVGFGPRLIGKKFGDTDYRISAIPLGGYVKMKGENLDEELTGDRDEFMSHPKSHRFLVAVAGPVFNIILAIAVPMVAVMVGITVSKSWVEPALVGKVEAMVRRNGAMLSTKP